jgi:UrcA family protein
MYTETCRPRRPFRPHTSVGTFAMFALFGLAPAAALADPPAVPVTATRSTKVPLADLDLDTPAGARVAYERIRRVAERLCDDREDPWSRYHAATYNACVRETVADAVRQIQAPALAALEK